MSRGKQWGVLLVSMALLGSWILAYPAASKAPPPGPAGARAPSETLCPPLSPPGGTIVDVSTVGELLAAVNGAIPGTTVRLADGTYNLDGAYLRIEAPGVTLRSASGDRDAVVLDGNYATTEIVQIVASNVTIADLTLREAFYHPIHVMSAGGSDTNNTLIYNVHIVDPGQQAIKINPAAEGTYADDGTVACSHIELTDAGRPQIWAINGSCYTGGVDAHQAQGWVIRDNRIEGFWCASDLSEHGIHFWRSSRDTVVERNVLVDNARGIGFGLDEDGTPRPYPDDPCPTAGGGYVDHYGGLIRNNFVFAGRAELFASQYGFDCGICLWQACGAVAAHNTVASTQDPFSSIEWRFDHTDVDLANNLVTYRLLDRGGTARLVGNLEYQPLSLFVDGPGGDLHLAPAATVAIDQAAPIPSDWCADDIDGDLRPIGSAPDVGADEAGLPPPEPVTGLRVQEAITATNTLTVTLGWTAPPDAAALSLRYAAALIDAANWPSAIPLDDALPGTAEQYTATLPYEGGTVFFALRAQDGEGEWSAVSANAFWPSWQIFCPLLLRNSH